MKSQIIHLNKIETKYLFYFIFSCFKTKTCYLFLASLESAMKTSLALNLRQFSCLCLPSIEINYRLMPPFLVRPSSQKNKFKTVFSPLTCLLHYFLFVSPYFLNCQGKSHLPLQYLFCWVFHLVSPIYTFILFHKDHLFFSSPKKYVYPGFS